LAGYTFPLLFLPGFFTQSLSTALIPAISEAMARGDGKLMHERMEQSMRIALFVGAPATAILYVWAVPLTALMYHAPEAGELVKILAPVFFLYYFEIPLHAILLGLGRAATAMWNYLIANVFEAAAIFIFGSHLGIQGVAVGLGFGICLLTLLNFMSVAATIGCYFDVRHWIKVSVSSAAMVICGSSAFAYMRNAGFSLLWAVLTAFAVSLPIYVMALLATGALKRSELRQLSSFKHILFLKAGK
jgi:stage V sporulation protein B